MSSHIQISKYLKSVSGKCLRFSEASIFSMFLPYGENMENIEASENLRHFPETDFRCHSLQL